MESVKGNTTVILQRIALVLILLAAGFLAVSGLFCRVDMNMENSSLENVVFLRDSVLWNIITLALFFVTLCVFGLVSKKEIKIPSYVFSLLILIWVVGIGTWFILTSRSAPTHDSYIVTVTGAKAANGDLSEFDREYYLRFPFQLGYVLWTEILCRVFSLTDHYLAIEVVNVFCLAIAEAILLRITDRIFSDRRVTVLLFAFLILFIQPILFCSFLYGTVPGMMFAVLMIDCFLSFRSSGKLIWALPMALCGTLAVLLKLNNMIPVAALCAVFLLILLKEYRDPKQYAALALLLASVLGLKGIGISYYEKKAEKDFGEGIPMVCWAAMGMTSRSISYGWYDAHYTVVNFSKCSLDPEATGKLAKDAIRERVAELLEDPAEGISFFSKKIVSQWHESTYQSVWTNQVRGQYGPKIGIAKWICGEGEYPVKDYMNRLSVVVYAGFFLSLFFLFGKKTVPEQLLLPAVFMGGFLYHAIFEGKSQYIIPYAVFLLPYAAYGWISASGKAVSFIRRRQSEAAETKGSK